MPSFWSRGGLAMSASNSSKRPGRVRAAPKASLTRISAPMFVSGSVSGTCRLIAATMASLSQPSSLSVVCCLLTMVISYPALSFDLRNMGEPQHSTLPWDMMATRSPSRSASSMKWVVRMMVRPSRAVRSISHVARREYGSMPDVGSSRMTSLGSPRSAIATDSFRFWPPEREEESMLVFSVRPTISMASAMDLSLVSWGSCFTSAKRPRCSRTVRVGQRTSCCGHTPRLRRTSCICVVVLLP
mmetsp:Transcript_4347/g.18386  ORF Transcript_4347/g.18386 Transcript_4347/m.18386 type:complete len:243 (+) Transcript_4347:2109-2837(+)